MHKLIFLCLIPAAIWSQQYYEASGQTRVFTLTAGAKAGPSAVLPGSRIARSVAPHMQVTVQNGVHISILGVQGQGRVSIYNLAGKTNAVVGNLRQFDGYSED